MNNMMIHLLWPFLAGMVLGAVFFGGLWYTVRKATVAAHPATWFVVSWLLRTALVLAGIYVVAGDRWQSVLICLIGFLLARVLVFRYTGRVTLRSAGRSAINNE